MFRLTDSPNMTIAVYGGRKNHNTTSSADSVLEVQASSSVETKRNQSRKFPFTK